MRATLERARDRMRGSGALPALTLGAVVLAAILLALALHRPRYSVRLTAGSSQGRRAEIARAFADACGRVGVDIELVDAPGSEEALARVERGELDAALVQGGLAAGPRAREILPLGLEPLHLLVRGDAGIGALGDLRDRRVDLSPPGSGTRRLALALLALAGLEPGRDFRDESLSYAELRDAAPDALPDAIFHVSPLPSPIASFLVHERGFRLVALPHARAMALRNGSISEGTIPAFTYGTAPPTPSDDLPTLATRMMLVGRTDLAPELVRRLLDAADSDAFVRATRLPRSARAALFEQPELELHEGTLAWLERDDPLFRAEYVETIENARSFIVSLVVALVLLWRWLRSRRLHGLDVFMAEVTELDARALELEKSPTLELPRLLELRRRLGETKGRALAAFGEGKIHSEELLTSFLTHVSDVRSHLNSMILHERERLEKEARLRAQGGDAGTDALRELWEEAIADELDDREVVRRR